MPLSTMTQVRQTRSIRSWPASQVTLFMNWAGVPRLGLGSDVREQQ